MVRQKVIVEADERIRDSMSRSHKLWEIKSRIVGSGLKDYLQNCEGWNLHSIVGDNYISHYQKTGKFKAKIMGCKIIGKPGFNLEIRADIDIPRKELIDLNALNEFVLSGKMPERVEDTEKSVEVGTK